MFGDHGTVQAQDLLGNTKWAWPHIRDGVTTRMKTGIYLQQLDSTEVPSSHLQRHSSETRYALLECPPNLLVGLLVCFVFYYP